MTATTSALLKNPKRVAAGRKNWLKRRGFTAEGLERLRQAALLNQPWQFATGPTSAGGKAKVALNGKRRQRGPLSTRELRAQLAGLRVLAREMREARGLVERALCNGI
jgi:hypothetical protein